ncbi:MAG: 30S ribosomal protein S24e [Methanobrevibacter sp.]|jgi:small subunit ribosomal protein S24e|nr:30S ribosomal protein S24e [Candidatus Methanovirga meridionalis]
MEIDIIQKKENKVLNRTEVKFDCIYTGKTTPKILDVKNKLVALLNTKKELLVIDSLQPNYGEAKATGYAKFYDSKENLESIEPKHIIEKNKEPEANSKEESAPDDEETASDEDKTTSDEE